MAAPLAPVPVSVLTGFLGSGKTTLLNALLKDPALTDTAVIVNEVGEISIDHMLVESAADGVIELAGGCLCCTVRGDLVDTLASLVDGAQTGRIASLKRVVVETTGLADPVPVLAALMAHPALAQAFRLDGVIATVDAVNGAATLARHREAARQAAVADRIVLTKTDLAEGEAAQDELRALLRGLNPGAPILLAAGGEASAAALFDCGLYDPATKTADVGRWLRDAAADDGHAHHHHDGHDHHDHDHDHDDHRHGSIRTMALSHPAPLAYAAIETFLDILRSAHGDKLLRLKAVVELADDPARPLVVHGVQRLIHPPARLPAWPDGPRGVRMVVIADGLDEAYVRRLFDAVTGRPAPDTPDRAALADNPLAISGLRG